MKSPALLGLTTHVPAHQHQQMDLHDRWLSPFIQSHRARAIFKAAEIETRHSVLETSDFLADEPGSKARNDLYMEVAPSLAQTAIENALKQANLTATEIDHFIVVSCTGFDCPGLDIILAKTLGMRSDLRRSALIGMGCYAGLTGLDRAMTEVMIRPKNHALVLTLEFTTPHFQHGKALKNMVAGAIFGDGLAAAIIGPSSSSHLPRFLDTMTYNHYQTQNLMGVHPSDTGYQIHLAMRVSKTLQKIVPDLVAEFLHRSGLSQADIRFWGLHPGGAKIITDVGEALHLKAEDLVYARRVLSRYGNMSSATIFFVLDEIIRTGQPQAGDYGLLLTFGPGLTVELCLMQW